MFYRLSGLTAFHQKETAADFAGLHKKEYNRHSISHMIAYRAGNNHQHGYRKYHKPLQDARAPRPEENMQPTIIPAHAQAMPTFTAVLVTFSKAASIAAAL